MTRRFRSAIIPLIAAAVFLLVPSAADGISAARTSSPPMVVVLAGRPTEHEFELSTYSVRRGPVIFKVVNDGKEAHGFQIDGHSTSLLRPHASATFRVDFKRPGKYVYRCVVTYSSPDDVPDDGVQTVFNPATCGGGDLRVT